MQQSVIMYCVVIANSRAVWAIPNLHHLLARRNRYAPWTSFVAALPMVGNTASTTNWSLTSAKVHLNVPIKENSRDIVVVHIILHVVGCIHE